MAGQWSVWACGNADCRLLWLDPLPRPDEIAKAYSSYYTHLDADASPRETVPHRVYRSVRRAYLSHRFRDVHASPIRALLYLHPGALAEAKFSVLYQSAPAPGLKLLDVGCGSGTALAALTTLGWQQVIGLDTDARAVASARSRGLDVRRGTVQSHHFSDETFDVITISHVIEHVLDPLGLLRECYRILRPGGSLYLVTPNTDALGHRLYRDSWFQLDPPRHIYLFNAHNLRRATLASGSWQIKQLASTVRSAGVALQAAREFRKAGHYQPSVGRAFRISLRAHLFYYVEAASKVLSPFAGEELLLVADKTATRH